MEAMKLAAVSRRMDRRVCTGERVGRGRLGQGLQHCINHHQVKKQKAAGSEVDETDKDMGMTEWQEKQVGSDRLISQYHFQHATYI